MSRRGDFTGPEGGDELDSLLDAAADWFWGLPGVGRWVIVSLLVALLAGAGTLYYRYEHQRVSLTVTHPGVPGDEVELPPPAAQAAIDPAGHLLLGNPSDARNDPSLRENYLLIKPFFALSYNDTTGTPNWVSWRVTASDLGDAPRQPSFDSDFQLPATFYRVAHHDYSGAGFDRGHVCPHSDRGANTQMSFATFVMSNVVPQAPNLNRKAWAQLEVYSRGLVRRGAALYTVAGPCGRGGTGEKGYAESIAGGRVTVPAECWKEIVVIPGGHGDDSDLARIDTGTRVISVIMPNDQTIVGEAWAGYRTSPSEVERRTGLHFFDRLPADVAQALREKVDVEPIAKPRPLTHVLGD